MSRKAVKNSSPDNADASKHKITSYCYLADPIDYFKKNFIRSFYQSQKNLLKKAVLKGVTKNKGKDEKEKEKNPIQERYQKHLIDFFELSSESIHIYPSEIEGKEGYLFIDPPNGISFNDSSNSYCFGSSTETENHIALNSIIKIINANKFSSISLYQHFARKKISSDNNQDISRDNLASQIVNFLNHIEAEDKKTEDKETKKKKNSQISRYEYAYVIQFKDFFILTISSEEDPCTEIKLQRKLKHEGHSDRLKKRFFEFKKYNKEWEINH